MKKLPIGIQSIEKILNEGEYVYIDKTGFIKKLIDEGIPHYFMSRPRRFGKSLFVNTLEQVFKGNKELFKGLEIYNSDYSWGKYPVLHFDFAKILSETPKDFKRGLEDAIDDFSNLYEIEIEGSSYLSKLNRLITRLSEKNRVVVLVDEYDSPIINHLKNLETAEKNRDLLKAFFGTLKSLDQYLKFTFVTGVTKFSQVSLFSGPNNLTDITMSPEYSTMMGYTEEELKASFAKYLLSILEERKNKLEKEILEVDILSEIRDWYNGYRFSEKETSVYNPYSTLRYFSAKKAEGFWYSTGTPSFLVDQVNNHPRSIVPLSGITASKAQLLDISDLSQIDLGALMFQTGYLTITDYNFVTNRYLLGFPNQEVRGAFFETLIRHFAPINTTLSMECQEALERHNPSAFFERMKSIIASFPYQLFIKASESTYHAILLGILKGMGFQVYGEEVTNLGRIDLVIDLSQTTYLIELKLDKASKDALKQIKEKIYYEKFLYKEKKVAIIGVTLSSKSRTISEWEGALFSPDGMLRGSLTPYPGE